MRGGLIARTIKELFKVMETFYVLIVVLVICVNKFVKLIEPRALKMSTFYHTEITFE